MVYRIFVERKKGFAHEAESLKREASELLKIKGLKEVRILNRYDAEGLSEELFVHSVRTVFSEPQTDVAMREVDLEGYTVFAVEYLPGQFDQRADSAAQCIQIISMKERPLVRSAKVYALKGELSEEDVNAIKKYVINPVEAREAEPGIPETLKTEYDIPDTVESIDGFISFDEKQLEEMINDLGLAMDLADISFCQEYFRTEQRDPTMTEIRMIDTYWSDHCRHTTFQTIIDDVSFEDELLQRTYDDYLATRKELGRDKPICLMDIATLAVKYLKKEGKLDKLDESEEINACTVKIEVEADGKKEPWLLLFKNETHNHPTEIEPFGGAATCVGGAIRDPLSGRAYVYGAIRLTGSADPTVDVGKTIEGKLPQRKIAVTAANGYSSYGNQIGLATGIVDEIYHPGYEAKHMEIGAVIAAAPAANVRREVPSPGDAVILLGGATGRDGVGGATGSSKAHDVHSVESCGAEVQKGNAPEERKLQRLFRNPKASRLIKRCNDFGAGGVSVAIGELADGLRIDLDAVPKKYEGLDGTELAISESQERMAVVVEAKDVGEFLKLSAEENLSATVVACVQEEPRLVMEWNGKKIVDISREFLDSNGAEKHISIETAGIKDFSKDTEGSFTDNMKRTASDLNTCSKRGLAERFDSTIGAGSVLMPFGGKHQLTPVQAMVQKISMEKAHTEDCSVMSWGYDPFITEKSPYHGAYLAVVESAAKLVAQGAKFEDVYLSFQEYFKKPGTTDGKRWGDPMAALLGAFRAQKELGIGAIGGKDSMSGSFEDIHVPPTLVSFAVTTDKTENIISPEFKTAGSRAVFVRCRYNEDGLPDAACLLRLFDAVTAAMRAGKVKACCTPVKGGAAEAVMKMAFGNGFGFRFDEGLSMEDIFGYSYGAFIAETDDTDIFKEAGAKAVILGEVTEDESFTYKGESIGAAELLTLYEDKLEDVYSCNIPMEAEEIPDFEYDGTSSCSPAIKTAKPKVLIPAFPGTNCEYDSARAVRDAGAEPEIMVINNLTAEGVERSAELFAKELKTSQMIFVPGGFSGGDEPDGSGKFITAFFRNAAVRDEVEELLDTRDGLICGICNGFQALIKLGLVPYGRITDTDENCPTLTFNTIGRHQSRIVRTRICSNKSPWLSLMKPGDIVNVPISHGEGRFIGPDELIKELAANGQIATQYVDLEGEPSMDIRFNPNGSMYAIEGITSPDGRVFGKMGHSERIGRSLYRNVPGEYDIRMFEAAVRYFK